MRALVERLGVKHITRLQTARRRDALAFMVVVQRQLLVLAGHADATPFLWFHLRCSMTRIAQDMC